ncbi:adenine deaminase, partial [Candidatus Bathyarchaeota archaeon]|nr:adenine deaminase [Candidatus Bathyarchaeota archaeon]
MEKNLIDVCLGRIKADLVVKCKSMLNVFSGEILDDISIAVKGDKIAYVGKNAETMMGTGTEVLKISDGTAVPGLIDAHTHMDMLCTPTEQAKHMLIHGTTTIFAEPDELTSVMGFEGFKTFVKETEKLPLKVYVTIPLAVPQDPKLSSVKPLPISAYKEALTWSNIIGLGETVAWTLMLDKDSHYIEKFKLAIEKGKLIEGHTAGARNAKLAACVCAGISSCHEAINPEQALERLRLGIFLMIREGSVRRDLTAILPDLVQRGIDLSNAALVSDWVDPLDLKELGYMDYIIDKAVEYGLDPVKAIQMVTINPARHFRMDQLIGSIAPGRYADITVLKSLNRPK